MEKSITKDFIDYCSRRLESNPQAKLVMNAVIKNGINAASINNQSLIDNQPVFSDEIDTGKVTNQKQSGRCWMFAGLNILRQRINEKLNISDFELSQCYTMFWDKFEKSNYFLESIIDTVEEESSSRIVMWILGNPIQDGGQWDMFCNIINKYGVVPKYVMPETYHSSQSNIMNSLLSSKLRQGAMRIRKLYESSKDMERVKEEKSNILGEVYGMLCCFLGEPPKAFNFEYRDKDNMFCRHENLTPVEFYNKFIDVNVDDYVSIINAPTKDKKFNAAYTVSYLGNVIGGRDIKYINVDIDTFKSLVVKQLKDREPVWFGCDVGKMSDSVSGVMDTELYDYNHAFNTDLGMSKGDRLDYGDSCLTHAMVFTGVNLKNDRPNRWKVENSWGDEKGQKGYFIMSDSWFDEYMYQIVINKKYLSDQLLSVLKQEPIKLNPWDPMGSLAVLR